MHTKSLFCQIFKYLIWAFSGLRREVHENRALSELLRSMGQIRCPETSVRNYPEERGCHLDP